MMIHSCCTCVSSCWYFSECYADTFIMLATSTVLSVKQQPFS